ncbi:uncharacterized protein LOC112568172 isoform X1 [Pomacea canaliculata]|uniref:uncharacterized protein LOC112568172 isoform X1 n=1 Tax=Pomacea canaliculata TaxID=400727 RepID=UPI000D731E1B|nr:uncharacterized protein LOC112568172 isoform X1 [Pomacea canaliculata]
MKKRNFHRKTLQERERQRDYFPLSSKTLESEIADSFKEGNNSPKKVQLGGDIGDGLYTDIDIPSQEQDTKYDNWTLFSERKGFLFSTDMTDTASSTSRARDHKKPCNYDNAVLPQSSIPSPAQDEPVFKTEDCELYDTLQRR